MQDEQIDDFYNTYDHNFYRITGEESSDSIQAMLLANSNSDNSASVTVAADTIGSGVGTATNTVATGSQQSGKNTFDNTETGYILGVDPKDGKTKFYIGTPSNYFNFDGTNVIISGTLTATTGTIGGWSIGSTTIYSSGIVIDSANQKLESTNYVSGVFGAGFHIDANFAEFGNVAVRGLIRTSVFQKDAVNVMGGNFCVLDGDVLSVSMTASDTSLLQIAGNTTFATGDILRIKDGADDEWFEVTGSITICDSYSESNVNTGFNIGAPATELGQSFTGINGTLDSAKFYLKKSGSPTTTAVARIYAHTGSYGTTGVPTGAVLATSDTIDVSTLGTDYALTTFTFSGVNRIAITVGTYYFVTVYFTHDSGANKIIVGEDTTTPTASGNSAYTGYGGWTASANDLAFYVYVTTAVAANPYSVTRDKAGSYGANANPAWPKGATVVNYRQANDGGVYMTASETHAPYLSIFDHDGSPWTTINTRLRIGNLNGYLGYSSDLYGIGIGDTNGYLTYDKTNGLRLFKSNIFLTGGGYISIGKTTFDNTDTGVIMGLDPADSIVKMIIGSPTEYLSIIGNTFTNTLKIGGYDVGDQLLASADTERSNVDPTTPTERKRITVGRAGNYRIYFDYKAYNGGSPNQSRNAHFRVTYDSVYVDEVGTVSLNIGQGVTTAYATQYFDYDGAVSGQPLSLWVYADGGVTTYVKNFRIEVAQVNEITPPVVNIN